MSIKKSKKITSLILTMVLISIPFGNSVFAYQNNTDESISQSVKSTLNNSNNLVQDLENKPELLESYSLSLEEVKKIEDEREYLNMNSDASQLFSENQVKLMKLEFQNSHGTDDKFKIISKVDNIICEVNGARGIIRTTTYGSKGNIENTYDVNYFESLDNLKNNATTLEI